MEHADAVIAGAGIIGLATALELASAGLRVTVFERGQAMRESSWAAAGMLAATDPENPSALQPLSALSINLYPEFIARTEKFSGEKIPFRTARTLQGTYTLPVGVEELSADAILSVAPRLRLGGLKFFLLEEQSLDPRDLARALPKAVNAAGVTLLEQSAVTTITPQPNSVLVRTSRGDWSATNFINGCGAWASDLASIPIAPRNGQMLLVDSAQPLTAVLRTPELYLVPRGNGIIVIGATVEDAGYDKDVDPSAIAALHSAAAALWPPIRDARILDTWAGLRPATTDSLPVIGRAIGIDVENGVYGCGSPHSWLALGHFRNGILLAPGTARVLRQMILDEPLSIDASAFSAGRFIPACAE
jgi:glycine oxidase